jgi:hypothetical protein
MKRALSSFKTFLSNFAVGISLGVTLLANASLAYSAEFDGTYTGSWSSIDGLQSDAGTLTFTVTNGVIAGVAAPGSISTGTVTSSGALSGSGIFNGHLFCDGGILTVTFTGQLTITSSGGAVASGDFTDPSPSIPNCVGSSGPWTATRTTTQSGVAIPVFPMVVSGSITPTVANITADIKYRPEDVGSTGSVYVFALAPANLVKNAEVPSLDKHFGPVARGKGADAHKDTPVACVLAQITSGGQLTAASAGSLQAYLTGVLSSQGASINVLNRVSTALIQGSVFYVGYGPNSTAMINNGINRSVVTVPGTQICQPQAPQTGWWWNKNEGGRGFSIETQGNHLFMAGYLYDESGRATWMTSGGLTSLDGSFYNSAMLSYANGQTLTGSYKVPDATATPGPITLTFNDARNGTLIWPGGAIPIERFDSQLPPSTSPPPAFAPENGWWWNKDESGRGYFLEFKNSFAFMAGYMYDASGNPLWYLSSGNMPVQQTFQGSWSQFANGQTMMGAWKPNTLINGNVGALSIQFQDTANATITLPDGRQLPITRFPF